jgi:hypothetical protein
MASSTLHLAGFFYHSQQVVGTGKNPQIAGKKAGTEIRNDLNNW